MANLLSTSKTPLSSSSRIAFSSIESESNSLDPFELEEDDDSQHEISTIPKTATWTSVGLLMIADVVGAGVMSLATAFAELGWVLAIFSLLFWYVVSMYTGLIISHCQQAYPEAETFMQLGRLTFGRKVQVLCGWGVYSFMFFVLGDYVLILGETLEMIMYKEGEDSQQEQHACRHLQFSALGLFLLAPLLTIRLLGKTSVLMIINMASILLSLFFAFGAEYGQTRQHEGTEWVAKSLTIYSFFHAQALFAFAYSGAFIYLEIISEMKHPQEFKKSLLYLAGPFQLVVYFLAGTGGYVLFGPQAHGLLIKLVPFGALYQLSALMLAVHMMITFLVKGTIVTRAAHLFLFPTSARDFLTWRSHFVFVCLGGVLLLGYFIVANLVPFFDDLTSLLGAFQSPLIGYGLPLLFAVKAKKKLHEHGATKLELSWMLLIAVFMVFLFGFGVTSSVENIVDKWQTYGAPFSGC